VYDDFIDHSYDQETDLGKRISMLMNSLTAVHGNIRNIWNQTYQRRVQNFKLIQSPEYQNVLLEDLRRKVS